MKVKTFLIIFSLSVISAMAENIGNLPSPLTLEGALDYALVNNPQLKIVKEQLKEQKGILVQSVSGMLPNISGNARANDVQNPEQVTRGIVPQGFSISRKNWSADVTLTQTLFAGGGIISGVRSSLASVQAAKARVTSAIESTVYNVKQSFYSVLINRQIILVRQESLQVLEEQLKNVQARREAGVASDFEVLQAQVAVSNERPLLIRAQNDYRISAEALLAVLGTPATLDINPDEVQGELVIEDLSVELMDLLAAAELYRADIRAANRDFAAAQSSVWTARSGYLPSVNFFVGYEWFKDPVTTDIGKSIDGWDVGLRANVPIFDGFLTAGRVYSAQARRRQASARELQTRLNVSVEVRQAYSAFTQSKEILISSQSVVEQARESLRLAKARFSAGSSTQLDVLQAESALSRARLTLLQAQYDYILSIARLEQATGSHDWKIQIKDKTSV